MPPPRQDDQRRFAVQVVERLREAGFIAYWAGGCVRDQLLGMTPKDYDVATDAKPDDVRKIFGQRRTLAIGAQFGVIAVLGGRRAGQVEVATFRQDAAYSDGRHPDQVTYSTPEEDAQRRDFTINGLFYDPHAGQVIDFVGGRQDLEQGVVRAIGSADDRFAEDKLRMLRAVRFAATFRFELESATLGAIVQMADQIAVVSAERIGSEIRRMLVDPNRAQAVELMRESRLLAVVLPEMAHFADDNETWAELLRVLGALRDPSLSLALAALLRDSREPLVADKVARRLKFTTKEAKRAQWLLDREDDLLQATQTPWPRLQRLLITDGIEELLALCEAVASADCPQLTHCRKQLSLPADLLNPPPLVTGDDLLNHGLNRGKQLGAILEKLRDAQLDGQITTLEQALALADRLVENPPVDKPRGGA